MWLAIASMKLRKNARIHPHASQCIENGVGCWPKRTGNEIAWSMYVLCIFRKIRIIFAGKWLQLRGFRCLHVGEHDNIEWQAECQANTLRNEPRVFSTLPSMVCIYTHAAHKHMQNCPQNSQTYLEPWEMSQPACACRNHGIVRPDESCCGCNAWLSACIACCSGPKKQGKLTSMPGKTDQILCARC